MADEKEHPLIKWASKQPRWRQHALRLLAKYGSAMDIPEDEKAEIKRILSAEANGGKPDFTPIIASDISNASASSPKTYLKSLGPVSNIDKLASEQLPFEFISPNGMTVIFGNNGSGKSGYARILKNLCRSHGEVKPLRGDATSETKTAWEVNLTYAGKEQGADEIEKPLTWTMAEQAKAKSDPKYTPLERIAFFDSHVANTYVDGDRTLFYLPPEIRLYKELVVLSDEFKESIGTKTKELENNLPSLPNSSKGTETHAILSKLKSGNVGEINQDEIDAICTLSDEEKKELEELRVKKRQTPEQQKLVIENAKATLITLNEDIEKITEAISSETIQRLFDSHKAYQDAKSNAEKGVAGLAKDMPISEGIGSDIWFEMFQAARIFASDIYPDTSPPPIANGEHCVLCHQDLNEDARERLRQFDAFMDDALQQEVEKIKEAFDKNLTAVSSLPELDVDAVRRQLQPYANLSDTKKKHSEDIVSNLLLVSSRLSKVKSFIQGSHFDDLQTIIDEKLSLETDFDSLISECNSDLEGLERSITEGATGLSKNDQSRLAELEDVASCISQKSNIERYLELSKQIASLQACSGQLSPNSITSQSRERRAVLYSDDLKNRYKSEISELELNYLKISLESTVAKGEQKIESTIDGLQRTKKSEILSEGEQRAVALAGFLTEVNEVDTGHAIIFDDPISSLDLKRKNQIAKRLVEEAKKRQVIIFTHDHSFLLALAHHSEAKSVHLQKQWICQKDGRWGITGNDAIAWQIKPVKGKQGRIAELKADIKKLKEDEDAGDITSDGSPNSSFAKRAIPIATKLREAWERAVEEIVFYETVQRYSPVIQTQRLSRVRFDGGSTDYAAFHEGVCGVVNENPHDSTALTPKLLTSAELEANLRQLEEWVTQIENNRPSKNEARDAQKEANRLGE